MGAPGFYNDNEFRAYPFIEEQDVVTVSSSSSLSASSGSVGRLPETSVVDAGFVMGIDSGYLEHLHIVYLEEVSRSGTTVTFKFRTV